MKKEKISFTIFVSILFSLLIMVVIALMTVKSMGRMENLIKEISQISLPLQRISSDIVGKEQKQRLLVQFISETVQEGYIQLGILNDSKNLSDITATEEEFRLNEISEKNTKEAKNVNQNLITQGNLDPMLLASDNKSMIEKEVHNLLNLTE